MPLIRSVAQGNSAVAAPQPAQAAATSAPEQAQAIVAAAKTRATKASHDVPMTKDEYWTRKEERDIETGKRIRRSGVWQAALQSMAGLQFNQGGTIESYLALVDSIAEHGLGWVNKD